MTSGEEKEDDCVIPEHPVPPETLTRYSIDRDPHSEADIASYVEGQAPDEQVQHVERIKREIVLGDAYDMWDVTTDKDRWWVISNLTNLYSQKHFPSLDYTLSFHVGLMMRIRSRESRVDPEYKSPFDEVFRREEQAEQRHDVAIEAEDFQAVGMMLRESLIALVAAMSRRVDIPNDAEIPKQADFVSWSNLLLDIICPGNSNKALRKHTKSLARETWQLVNWLTHARNADQPASSVSIHSSQTIIGHLIQLLERSQVGELDLCPVCASRDVRVHFDISIGEDGAYFRSCGVCNWDDRPDGE